MIVGIRIVVIRDSCRLFSRVNRLVSDANRTPDFNSNRFIPRGESQFEHPDEYDRVLYIVYCDSFIRILLLAFRTRLHFPRLRQSLSFATS